MTDEASITYITWGGRLADIKADLQLGDAAQRRVPAYGIRRAIWDAAFGYVNGFPLSAIAYYVLTRSLSQRLMVCALRREGILHPERVGVSPMPFQNGSD